MTDSEIELCVQAIEPDVPIDKIAEAMMMAEAFKQRATQMVDLCKARMQEWIEANGRAIEWPVDSEGHVRRFYLEVDKETKCIDPAKALELLLEFDIKDVACCLASGAWKPGATKKMLEALGKRALFDQLFKTVEKKRVAEDKPVKRLQSCDTRFLD